MSRAETAVREIATRSLSGTVGHVLMLAASLALAPGSTPLVAWIAFAIFIPMRILGRHRKSLPLLATAAIGCNGLWGLLVANVYHTAGFGQPSVVYAFFLCGIATGSVQALAPIAWLQRIAILVLTVPAIVIGLAGAGVLAFAFLHTIFVAYTLVMGTVATREFWQTMHAVEKSREDVAQRLAIEVELRQAQKLEAIGRLAAGIAHEINTPVQFVTDSCTFLSDGIANMEAALADYRKLVGDLGGDARRVAEVDDAHDLVFMREHMAAAAQRSLSGLERVAKIVRATKEFAASRSALKAPANLNAAIESTLVICGHETGGVADVVTELGTIPMVDCAGGELNQVFLNIIVNAAHAIAEKHADKHDRGTIKIRTWAPGDGWVKIAISDTGVGIPAEILDKIFEPFFTTKPVGKGTGQGLAIARSVVGKHGGQLDVASQPGVGTTFTIALPA